VHPLTRGNAGGAGVTDQDNREHGHGGGGEGDSEPDAAVPASPAALADRSADEVPERGRPFGIQVGPQQRAQIFGHSRPSRTPLPAKTCR
jgi:hypothetical protein